MFTVRRTTKAFRPSRHAPDLDLCEEADVPQTRELRIRTYMRRVRLHQPLFGEITADQAGPVDSVSAS